VEVVAGEFDGFEFGVGDLDAGRIGVWIELATNLQACLSGGCGDQFDDDLVTDQRLAAPVSSNERKQAVLDLVPLCAAET